MISQTWWYVARASGIVAWGLGVASVLWGTLLSTRILGTRPRGPWLLDLHRFLGGATVLFVGLHVGALVADSYEQFGLADVLLPFASGYQSIGVALGIVAMWLLLAVELSSLVMKRLPRHVWHTIHLLSYAVAFLSSVHLLVAGTDAGNPVLRVAAFVWMPAVVGLLVYRQLAPPLAPKRPTVAPTPAA
jgi:DMSO/TMAO reductase YedYZ heme-binding membrane subunit